MITKAPNSYDGTLNDFYDAWAESVLLDPSIVEEFHRQFCAYYLSSADPLFLVRMVSGQERGEIQRVDNGAQLCATDNAPAWWVHYQLFYNHLNQYTSFDEFIKSIPCHMFDIRKRDNISAAGWHVAHIFDAKNRDVGFRRWEKTELVRRTARNIHPCNYFYIAKNEWQRYGGDPRVIAFFYDKFKARYRTIWDDFLKLVDGKPQLVLRDIDNYQYSFHYNQKNYPPIQNVREKPGIEAQGCAATYEFSRLCFKADVIEPLEMDDRFCIVTKVGTFVMSKRDFYETFSNVVKSKSYMQGGIYHYPTVPRKALKFKAQ